MKKQANLPHHQYDAGSFCSFQTKSMNSRFFTYRGRLMTATALLSAALIACQVAFIQLLSYAQWYHYANMVISIALLGFGAAGSFLSLKRKWLLQHSDNLLPLLMIFCGAYYGRCC